MKIRTRIIWISCGAILAASLLGDAIIWILAGKSFRDEAFIRAYQKTYVFAENFERAIGDDPERAGNDSYLSYYFKAQNDDYNICIRAGEEAARRFIIIPYLMRQNWQSFHTVRWRNPL